MDSNNNLAGLLDDVSNYRSPTESAIDVGDIYQMGATVELSEYNPGDFTD